MKKLTVTIGIPAYNEEGNIVNLLNSISKQNTQYFTIREIIIACDGCTDNTVKKIKEYTQLLNKIRVIDGDKQLGKKARLMEIYRESESELIVTFDGDTVLVNSDCIDNVVRHMQDNNVITSFSAIPAKPDNITSFLIVSINKLWNHIAKKINKGNNVYNIKSCGLGMRSDFAKKIRFNNTVLSDAQYIYFFAKQMNQKFIYVSDAIIYYRVPNTYHDYFLQARRIEGNADVEALVEIFGSSVLDEYTISFSQKIRGALDLLNIDPVAAVAGVVFKIVTDQLPISQIRTANKSFWEPVKSTKRGIVI